MNPTISSALRGDRPEYFRRQWPGYQQKPRSQRWWWRNLGPWGFRPGPWSLPPALRRDLGPRKGHSGSPVLVLSAAFPSVTTHLFKPMTTSGHPLIYSDKVLAPSATSAWAWPLTGFQNFFAETILHDSFLPEFCHQRTNSSNWEFSFQCVCCTKILAFYLCLGNICLLFILRGKMRSCNLQWHDSRWHKLRAENSLSARGHVTCASPLQDLQGPSSIAAK